MMLVKALETRKKQEEREKAREEKRMKLVKEREQKQEQRRMEDQMQEELRRPVEDMMLKDHEVKFLSSCLDISVLNSSCATP